MGLSSVAFGSEGGNWGSEEKRTEMHSWDQFRRPSPAQTLTTKHKLSRYLFGRGPTVHTENFLEPFSCSERNKETKTYKQ